MQALQKWDTIAILALSKALPLQQKTKIIQNISSQFQQRGLHTIFYPSCFETEYLDCPSIDSRINDFHNALQEPKIKWMMILRWGRNSNQLLDHIDYALLKKNKKPIIGYSDITTILNAIYHKTQQCNYHGPLAIDFLEDNRINHLWKESLYQMLFSPHSTIQLWDNPRYIQAWTAQGVLVWWNLTSFLQLAGTKYFPKLQNKIIFLEDTPNTPLNFRDRALHHLWLQKWANQIQWILIGKTGTGHHITPQNWEKLFSQIQSFQNIPIIANLDFGHIPYNQTLIIWEKYNIQSPSQ